MKKVSQLFSKHRVSKIVSSVWCRAEQAEKNIVCCTLKYDACTTSNDVRAKSKFVLYVILEHKMDLNIVAIPLPRDRD